MQHELPHYTHAGEPAGSVGGMQRMKKHNFVNPHLPVLGGSLNVI